ncbi:cation:proton antiporter [Leptospira sp. WS92.C1]
MATRFRLPPLIGYLFAGIFIGPFPPGYIADLTIAPQLAELGVILLIFGVGLHFSLDDLLSVKSIAILGAVVQIAIATVLGILLALEFNWSLGEGFVFGLCLSTVSTVVLLRAMQERNLLKSFEGKIAVGWLIVEDGHGDCVSSASTSCRTFGWKKCRTGTW